MTLRGGDPYVPLSIRLHQNLVMPSPACVNGYLPPAYVNQSALSAFTAYRLIALNKCPGIRSIGVGEMARYILGKAILTTIRNEVQEAAGALQLCAGQQAGCKSAVHAMR